MPKGVKTKDVASVITVPNTGLPSGRAAPRELRPCATSPPRVVHRQACRPSNPEAPLPNHFAKAGNSFFCGSNIRLRRAQTACRTRRQKMPESVTKYVTRKRCRTRPRIDFGPPVPTLFVKEFTKNHLTFREAVVYPQSDSSGLISGHSFRAPLRPPAIEYSVFLLNVSGRLEMHARPWMHIAECGPRNMLSS